MVSLMESWQAVNFSTRNVLPYQYTIVDAFLLPRQTLIRGYLAYFLKNTGSIREQVSRVCCRRECFFKSYHVEIFRGPEYFHSISSRQRESNISCFIAHLTTNICLCLLSQRSRQNDKKQKASSAMKMMKDAEFVAFPPFLSMDLSESTLHASVIPFLLSILIFAKKQPNRTRSFC